MVLRHPGEKAPLTDSQTGYLHPENECWILGLELELSSDFDIHSRRTRKMEGNQTACGIFISWWAGIYT